MLPTVHEISRQILLNETCIKNYQKAIAAHREAIKRLQMQCPHDGPTHGDWTGSSLLNAGTRVTVCDICHFGFMEDGRRVYHPGDPSNPQTKGAIR